MSKMVENNIYDEKGDAVIDSNRENLVYAPWCINPVGF
tara:strand:+ start:618 stop:731 length:114 start_codon:yes stop_codon:yes gene_type:complete